MVRADAWHGRHASGRAGQWSWPGRSGDAVPATRAASAPDGAGRAGPIPQRSARPVRCAGSRIHSAAAHSHARSPRYSPHCHIRAGPAPCPATSLTFPRLAHCAGRPRGSGTQQRGGAGPVGGRLGGRAGCAVPRGAVHSRVQPHPVPCRVCRAGCGRRRRRKEVFGITSNTLVRSSRSPSGPAGGASDDFGLGRGAAGPDRRCTTTTPGHSESLLGRIHP